MTAGGAVVVTGAGSGIGRAAADAFAARGYHLVLAGRREAPLLRAAGELGARFPVEALAVPCDVRRQADVQRLVDTAVDRFGRLSVFVNSAGIGYYARVEDTSEEDFRDLIDTNLLGAFHAIRAAVPVMRRQNAGHLALVGSVVGKRGWPLHGAYAATKFALAGLTQSLRAELAGTDVSVSLILPSSTRTPFFASARVGTRGFRPKPTGLVQSPETVARAIASSVEKPQPEINTVGLLRIAWVLAEAFPGLPDSVARWYYSRSRRRLAPPASSQDRAAERTSGRP